MICEELRDKLKQLYAEILRATKSIYVFKRTGTTEQELYSVLHDIIYIPLFADEFAGIDL